MQQRTEQALAALDRKYTREPNMKPCAALLLKALAGCASRELAIAVPGNCPKPLAPSAWTLQEPSNSLLLLDVVFSISGQ
ncbi:hypothetical protein PS3A_25940 [Pseudomonas sp. 3A(2025)]